MIMGPKKLYASLPEPPAIRCGPPRRPPRNLEPSVGRGQPRRWRPFSITPEHLRRKTLSAQDGVDLGDDALIGQDHGADLGREASINGEKQLHCKSDADYAAIPQNDMPPNRKVEMDFERENAEAIVSFSASFAQDPPVPVPPTVRALGGTSLRKTHSGQTGGSAGSNLAGALGAESHTELPPAPHLAESAAIAMQQTDRACETTPRNPQICSGSDAGSIAFDSLCLSRFSYHYHFAFDFTAPGESGVSRLAFSRVASFPPQSDLIANDALFLAPLDPPDYISKVLNLAGRVRDQQTQKICACACASAGATATLLLAVGKPQVAVFTSVVRLPRTLTSLESRRLYRLAKP